MNFDILVFFLKHLGLFLMVWNNLEGTFMFIHYWHYQAWWFFLIFFFLFLNGLEVAYHSAIWCLILFIVLVPIILSRKSEVLAFAMFLFHFLSILLSMTEAILLRSLEGTFLRKVMFYFVKPKKDYLCLLLSWIQRGQNKLMGHKWLLIVPNMLYSH